ncbi:MAG: flagellin [Bauldia sp.]
MSEVTLSAAIRKNLLSLQQTADLMSTTQTRLATGKKVNSALDNPTAYFTAQSLDGRSSQLATILDSVGQAVQTIQAANNGMTAIEKLIEAAKAKANQAQITSNTFLRASALKEYNELLVQITAIAKDSGYNGKNLIGGLNKDLNVIFNEDSSNHLLIKSVDIVDTDTGLGLPSQTEAVLGTLNVSLAAPGPTPLMLGDLLIDDTTNFDNTGDTLTFTDSSSTVIGSIDVTPTMTVADLIVAINSNFTNVRASFSAGTLKIETTEDIDIAGGKALGALAAASITATSSAWQTDSSIAATLNSLNGALDRLHSYASGFSNSLTILQDRQAFTKQLINTLTEGSDALTLADTNEEGANLLALQTRQQLSTTALSLANQAQQGVLRLFQ